MNFSEIYKIIGAIVGAFLFVIGLGFIAQAIYVPAKGNGGGYILPVPKTTSVAAGTAVAAPPTPLPVLLASASADNGKQIARKCQACHELSKGGASSDGPVLYGVVGRPSGTIPGYKYSDTLKAMAAKGDIWTYERLNKFITAPRKFAPGTKMPFRGLPKAKDRADVLAYLQTLSDAPVPFPPVENAGGNATTKAATGTSESTTKPAQTTTKTPATTKPETTSTTTPATTTPASSGSGDNGALAIRLASASVDKGKQIVRKCAACHDLSEGGRNKFGPALYGVVGRPVGTHPGYKYSSAFKALAAKGDIWTYAALDRFLTKPREDVKGTKMSFRGLPKEEDRADVLAYLQTLSASPVPFPAAKNAADNATAPVTPKTTGTSESTTKPAQTTTETVAGTTTPAPAATTPASSGSGEASALSVLLASASVDKGKQIARKCTACHDLSEGGRNKFGPALYGVVGRPVGTHPGYKYSSAFKALAAKGDIWTYVALDRFLTKPREDVKGTKMSFRGLAKPEDRANLLAYLQTLSASPVAFP